MANDFPVIVIFILFVNSFYIIYNLFPPANIQVKGSFAEPFDAGQVEYITVHYNGNFVRLHIREDILYFYREGKVVKLHTISGKTKRITVEIIAALLILLWVYAAISKLIPFQTSYTQLTISPYIRDYAGILVWLVPVIELILCLLLLVPRFRVYGIAGSFILLTAFTAYIIAVLTFREHPPCSCGGIISKMSWTQHIFFNLFFMVMAAVGYWLSVSRKDDNQQDIKKVVQTGTLHEPW